LREGFPPAHILVNGPAKHHWLPGHPVRGLFVNFDSATEAAALAALARKLHWTTGLRFSTDEEFDPEAPEYPTQFGMTAPEATEAWHALKQAGVEPQIAHFHLRTNVASPASYQRAFDTLAQMCRQLGFAPRFVDCGGGFPPPHVLARTGRPLDARFNLERMARVCERAFGLFPGMAELWLENGRWLAARSGVLVVRILDVKERRGMRHLICDGGRTGQALVSNWEMHEMMALPMNRRRGRESLILSPSQVGDSLRRLLRDDWVLTTVTGPTCMAFDQLARRPLPRSLRAGDHLLWLEAGAYHLPWETRFSHGLCAALWHDGRRTRCVRPGESFETWWGQREI
jgi:diaminopimelate decarboxylase